MHQLNILSHLKDITILISYTYVHGLLLIIYLHTSLINCIMCHVHCENTQIVDIPFPINMNILLNYTEQSYE